MGLTAEVLSGQSIAMLNSQCRFERFRAAMGKKRWVRKPNTEESSE
ncbi:hypothetical protein [Pirellula sp. SH-Sr6A]|nr:hypothetical protein [Pirellula sp. SH-Sr6A]